MGVALLNVGAARQVRAAPLPDPVKIPVGLNLGSTSFYDGEGTTDPTFILIEYEKALLNNRFNTGSGAPNTAFVNPQLNAFANINQFIYVSPLKLNGGAFGFMAVVQDVGLSSHFGQGGVQLTNNGFGLGDLYIGPFYQGAPILKDGKPFIYYRAEFDAIAPVGAFNTSRDINIGSGYWSLNPYLAITVLPLPKFEVSTRLQYVYDYKTSRFSDPVPIQNFYYRSGQAGSAGFLNFDASYLVDERLGFGVNGFYLRQFDDDKVNNLSVQGSRETLLYLGPGMHVKLNKTNFADFNVYLPVDVRDTTSGPQFNLHFIHVLE